MVPRGAAAKNPRIVELNNGAVLRALAKNKNSNVRQVAAKNPGGKTLLNRARTRNVLTLIGKNQRYGTNLANVAHEQFKSVLGGNIGVTVHRAKQDFSRRRRKWTPRGA